jgi:hypothetical protein
MTATKFVINLGQYSGVHIHPYRQYYHLYLTLIPPVILLVHVVPFQLET